VGLRQDLAIVFLNGEVPGGDAAPEGVLEAPVDLQGLPGVLVARLGGLVRLGDALCEGVQVGQDQLHVDDLDITNRVDGAVDVGDVGVVEAADDVDDGVHLTDVTQELVAQAFALAGAPHEAGDVDELHGRVGDLGGLDDGRDVLEAFVRDVDDSRVGVDRAEGVIGHLRPGAGQRVEQGRFPHVGKADDAAVESHARCPEGLP